ncbi:phage major capsid protein [Rhodococcus spongiicola]|uniref:phage major capsid protein n=1 Tax=Rhodococcus spongiicola TaxID=2487352 RepID=UPI0013E2CC0C|nr:phage major capsid protein [Rhodococcus spongiicola]
MGLLEVLKAKQQRAAELAAQSGEYSADELAEAQELAVGIPELKSRIEADEKVRQALADMKAGGDPDDPEPWGGAGKRGYLRLKGDALASRLAHGMLSGPEFGRKALAPAGESVAPVQVETTPVPEGRPVAGLLDLVPAVLNSSARFEYLRQTTREYLAAPVTVGAVKPTSRVGLSREAGDLQVIAHLSEPIDNYLLTDFPSLEMFVRDELVHGLAQALEKQILSGDGMAPNLRGILGTEGIREQAFAVDAITSARKAITQLEAQGLEPSGFCFSPADWEAIELARTSGSGALELVDSPVDRAARRLHGVPVAVSAGLEDGRGVLVSSGSVALRVDAGIAVRWSENVGNSFEKNEIRARAELRAATQIQRPSGVVVVETAAA